MKKVRVAIVNSSTFGKHHPDHIARLEQFAELDRVNVPPDVAPETLTEKLTGVHGVIASVTPKFTRKTLEALPDLKVIARHGIGCDNVDLDAAAEHGIPVSNVEGVIERHAVVR